MRVLQVTPGIDGESSGPTYSVPAMCRGLKMNGVDVELLTPGNVPERDYGCPVQGFERNDFPYVPMGRATGLLKYLRQNAPLVDVIHANGLWLMSNVYPYWAAKGTKCKLVVAPRGTLAAWSLKKGWLKKKIFGWLLQNQVLRRADMFHATSEKEYEEIRAAGYEQPVAIVPIGMELPNQGRGKREEGIEREGNRLHRVTFFGRLHKVKAVDRLVQAWELLTKKTPGSNPSSLIPNPFSDWELVIAGPDCGARGELEQYIAAHKIPRVRFVGEINGPAKYEFLSDADLYVLPSFTENFGITVAEALACGTPVIVSKGTPWRGVEGENGEGGEKGRCGWWVENTPEVLAETLREAMALSDEERAVMGENGKEWIRCDFSWEGIGARMKAAYEWLLNDGERPEYVKID